MRRAIVAVVLASALSTLLTACIAISKPPTPLGPDTWLIAVTGDQSATVTKAPRKAAEFCADMGREMVMINLQPGQTVTTFTFRCLPPGDPELVRPDIEVVPDATIEVR